MILYALGSSTYFCTYAHTHKKIRNKMSVLKHLDEIRVLGNQKHCLSKKSYVRFIVLLTVNGARINVLWWEDLLHVQT